MAASARWIGKDALRQLKRPTTAKRLATREKRAAELRAKAAKRGARA